MIHRICKIQYKYFLTNEDLKQSKVNGSRMPTNSAFSRIDPTRPTLFLMFFLFFLSSDHLLSATVSNHRPIWPSITIFLVMDVTARFVKFNCLSLVTQLWTLKRVQESAFDPESHFPLAVTVFFFNFSQYSMLKHGKLKMEQRIVERLLGFTMIGFNMVREGPRISQKEVELARDRWLWVGAPSVSHRPKKRLRLVFVCSRASEELVGESQQEFPLQWTR